ncbi:MAG TPA: STAS domain-containing protein [Devosiaceae bacterium]|jgi:anti-anti-sigma regulatory factor|nr:STAS domain-containing protein [Devosiaceae bacterium]
MAEARTKSIALPAVVDLDALDAVRDRLIEAVDAGPVAVSGANVERVVSNALLLLISAAETARRNGFEFKLMKASAPMLSAIERLGLSPSFAGMMRG